jgi:hypothetical protein
MIIKKIPHHQNRSKVQSKNRKTQMQNQHLQHDHSLPWLSGGVKLIVWDPLSEVLRSFQCFPYVSNIATLTYN